MWVCVKYLQYIVSLAEIITKRDNREIAQCAVKHSYLIENRKRDKANESWPNFLYKNRLGIEPRTPLPNSGIQKPIHRKRKLTWVRTWYPFNDIKDIILFHTKKLSIMSELSYYKYSLNVPGQLLIALYYIPSSHR